MTIATPEVTSGNSVDIRIRNLAPGKGRNELCRMLWWIALHGLHLEGTIAGLRMGLDSQVPSLYCLVTGVTKVRMSHSELKWKIPDKKRRL